MAISSGNMSSGKKNPKQGTGKGQPGQKKKGIPAQTPKTKKY
jgi:hypothetical protein